MDIRTEIYLNQLAQGVLPVEDAAHWFSHQDENAKLEILRRLTYFAAQSGATAEDSENAIRDARLKPTYTPCRLLKSAESKSNSGKARSLKAVFARILDLPEDERVKSFRLLLALFTIAYTRKRNQSMHPERRWWFRDLSDSGVVEDIISGVQ